MSTPFQNRLVGTIMVAALAIIFLPDIFDGKKQVNDTDFESIPQAPKFESARQLNQFPENELAQLNNEEPLSDEVALDDEYLSESDYAAAEIEQLQVNIDDLSSDAKPQKIKLSLYPQPKDIELQQNNTSTTQKKIPEKAIANEAWVIQLGSFRHKKNVEELALKLKANGYTAFTAPIKTKSGDLTKVFVGPELIKSSLEKKLPALKVLTNVDGKIARFYPSK